MTIREMGYDFDLKIDKVASFSKEDFNVAEKDWLLNEAQNVFIKTRYGMHNSYGFGFEVTQKRIDDLSKLVVKFPLQPALVPTLNEGIYEVSLSQLAYDYMFFIRGQALVDKECSKWASLNLVQHDDLNHLLCDPFNDPDEKEVPFNFGRSTSVENAASIYIYPGQLTIYEVKLEYIQHPPRLNSGGYVYIDNITYPEQDCMLAEHTHPEIVDIAVAIASGIIEHPDYVSIKNMKLKAHE